MITILKFRTLTFELPREKDTVDKTRPLFNTLPSLLPSLSPFRRFNLIDPKETEVLHDLEVALRLTEDSTSSSSCNSSDAATQQQQQQTSLAAAEDCTNNGVSGAGLGQLVVPGSTTTTTTTTGTSAAATTTTMTPVPVGATTTTSTVSLSSSNQTGAIKCKSSINCGITAASSEHHHQQPHHHHHQHGEGCGSGCSESMMYSVGGSSGGGLDMRPPIVNQPESGENNVFT